MMSSELKALFEWLSTSLKKTCQLSVVLSLNTEISSIFSYSFETVSALLES